jgi:hypothetical protein
MAWPANTEVKAIAIAAKDVLVMMKFFQCLEESALAGITPSEQHRWGV